MRKASSRRRLVAALALLAVAVAMSAGAFLHESRAESDGACVACIFALSTVGVHVAVFTWTPRPVLVGFVEPCETTARRWIDRLTSDSRGPPLA
jgi:hypothetical protein